MPSFDNCNGPFLQKIADDGVIRKITGFETVAVEQPTAYTFSGGGYIIVKPPKQGQEKKLILDHQIDYPQNAIGKQRMEYDVRPESYLFLATARPLAVGIKSSIMAILEKSPYFGFTRNNALYVNDRIVNPREEFSDGEFNWEILAHEMVDRVVPPTILEESLEINLVGRWTTSRVGHDQEMQAVKAMFQGDGGVIFTPLK
jgi:UDP-3-O-acyl-N-acetylglucosamine deacetylase